MKYVPGPMVGLLSRSQGNTTAARNRGGAYLRNRVVPTNPRTDKQTLQRELIATLSAQYRTLGAEAIEGWTQLGAQIVRRDSLGQEYTLSGLQAFTSVNRVRYLFDKAFVTTAPTLDDPPAILTAAFGSITDEAMTVVLTPDDWAVGQGLIFEFTAGVSPGRLFFPRSEYRFLQAVDGPDSPVDVFSAYKDLFNTPAADTRIGCRLRPVSAHYFVGAEVRFSGVVST
jgi:hypothetical protein